MLIFTSPAKTFSKNVSYELPRGANFDSLPVFLEQANQLALEIGEKSVGDLADYLSVSESLAEINYSRYQDFDLSGKLTSCPALQMYVFRLICWT